MSVAASSASEREASRRAERLTTVRRALGWASVPLLALALYMAFVYAPPEATMGQVYRIFFFHMPSAISAFAGFFVTFVASIAYLKTRRFTWDAWAVAGAEVGILFASVAIVTGSFWARPVWNTWWTWDPRLTTVTIMWLTYIAYLMLREAVDEPERRARLAAVMGIIAFANVPLVWLSARWFRTIHPVLFGGSNPDAKGDFALAPSMAQALMVGMVAILVLFGYFLVRRVQLEQARVHLMTRHYQDEEG